MYESVNNLIGFYQVPDMLPFSVSQVTVNNSFHPRVVIIHTLQGLGNTCAFSHITM